MKWWKEERSAMSFQCISHTHTNKRHTGVLIRERSHLAAGAAGGAPAKGFLRTRMTESPLRNILEMKRSLLTGLLCKNNGRFSQLVVKKVTELMLPSSCLCQIWASLSTSLWHSPGPCCSACQRPWHVRGASCCSGSWWGPECCSWLIVWGRRAGQCWTPLLHVWPAPPGSFPTWVCSLQPCKNERESLFTCPFQRKHLA